MNIKNIVTNKFTRAFLVLTICILASALPTNAAPRASDNLANGSVLSGATGTINGTNADATPVSRVGLSGDIPASSINP